MHPEIAPSRLEKMSSLLPRAERPGTVLLPHLDTMVARLIAHALVVRGHRVLTRAAVLGTSPLGFAIPTWDGEPVSRVILFTSPDERLGADEDLADLLTRACPERLLVVGDGPPRQTVLTDATIAALRAAPASHLLLRHGPLIEPRHPGRLEGLVDALFDEGARHPELWGTIHAEDLAVAAAMALDTTIEEEVWVGLLGVLEGYDLLSGLEQALGAGGFRPTDDDVARVRAGIPEQAPGPAFEAPERLWSPDAIGRILAHLWIRERLWKAGTAERVGWSPFQIEGRWWRLALADGVRASDLQTGLCTLEDPATAQMAGVLRLAHGRWWSAAHPESEDWNTVDGAPQRHAVLGDLLSREAAWDPPLAPRAAWAPRTFFERILELGFDDRWIQELIRFGARNAIIRPAPEEVARWT